MRTDHVSITLLQIALVICARTVVEICSLSEHLSLMPRGGRCDANAEQVQARSIESEPSSGLRPSRGCQWACGSSSIRSGLGVFFLSKQRTPARRLSRRHRTEREI